MEHGRVANLHVADVLARCVFRELEGGAVQRVFGLQNTERDVERLQVFDERPAVLAEVHGTLEALGIFGRELDALFLGKLKDRSQSQ